MNSLLTCSKNVSDLLDIGQFHQTVTNNENVILTQWTKKDKSCEIDHLCDNRL